jgi:hypothetical protein
MLLMFLLHFISDVSLKVGSKTKMKYFVIEIHYMDPVKSKCFYILIVQVHLFAFA